MSLIFFNPAAIFALKMNDMVNVSRYPTIIDVRTQQEFEEGHLPNAINIPLDQVPHQLKDIEVLPTPMLLYCRSGNRSGMAVSFLKQQGISDVVNGGGIDSLQ